jgi:molybdopterin/thiamine biosynthesis adenylyltransferase
VADALVHERVYRGEAVLSRMAALHIVVCGAGAVGSNLVDNLTRQGFRTVTVVDDDRVEAHNIPTQVWSRREVGQFKALMLKNIAYNSSGAPVEAVTHRLNTGNVKKVLSPATLVVDGFDNSESRGLVTAFCREAKKDCLHIGLAKDYAEVIWNETYRVPRDVVGLDVCEYPMARNTILLAVAIASETIVKYVATGKKQNYVMTLGDLKVEEVTR